MGIHWTWKHDYDHVVPAADFMYKTMWEDGLRPRIHWGKVSPFHSEQKMNEVFGDELTKLQKYLGDEPEKNNKFWNCYA